MREKVPTPAIVKAYGTYPGQFYFYQCLIENGLFPYIANLLKLANVRIETAIDIVRILEAPVNTKGLSDKEKEAWEFYYFDRGAFFEYYYDNLLMAEAWLSLGVSGSHIE